MTDHTTFRHHESPELHVLEAIARGATTSEAVAAATGQSPQQVGSGLGWAVQAQLVTRLDLPEGPSYQLTPQGLELVGLSQGVGGVVSPEGHVDLGGATRMVMEQYAAARDVATEAALRDQAGWLVDDAARDRVTAALNDAFARGALTKEQLDERTGRALTAGTMGELRAVAAGITVLPPLLPAAGVQSTGQQAGVVLNPALSHVRWRRLPWVPLVGLVGMFFLSTAPALGLVLLVGALGLAVWALWPLLATRRRTH